MSGTCKKIVNTAGLALQPDRVVVSLFEMKAPEEDQPMQAEMNRGASVQRVPAAVLARPVTASMERILVVEDDRAVQKALRRLFESEGFAVEISPDGKTALEVFRNSAPAAIVLDLRLPLVSGRDVCRQIKEQAPT